MANNVKTIHGHAAMLTANMLWGLMAPVSKDTLNYFKDNDISPFVLPALRMGGAALAFWILSLFLEKQPTTWNDKGKLFLAGMLSITFNQCLFIVGVSYTSPIDASVVTTMLPIATMILAAIVLREPITKLKALGVIVGMAGALQLIFSNGHGFTLDHDHFLGDSLCLIAQICFASYLVFFKNFISKFSPVTLMKWMFLFATITFVPFQLKNILAIDFAAVPAKVYLEICYTVFVATFFTFLLVPTGQKYLRPTVVSAYNYVQPIMSTVVSLYWGLATFDFAKGMAIFLVFAGVYIVTRSKSRQQLIDEGKIS